MPALARLAGRRAAGGEARIPAVRRVVLGNLATPFGISRESSFGTAKAVESPGEQPG